MKKILITGSNGFIGSHAKRYFTDSNYAVYSCDTGSQQDQQNYFSININQPDYKKIFAATDFDLIIHCAGTGSVAYSFQHPDDDYLRNTTSCFQLLKAMQQANSKAKFIYLSSAAVYGNPQSLPIAENSQTNPLSPYGKHKLLAEQVCKEYAELYNLKICVVRIFSAYGEGLKKQLLWDIYQKFKENKNKITLFGSGNETRDFVHIDDVMLALSIIAESNQTKFEIYNIASGIETKIKAVAETLLNELNFKGELFFNGATKAGDPTNWKADLSKMNDLGFAPKISLDEGIKRYTSWLKELEY
ncbi:MAG: SDR family oxidoreductase [Crocinitomicaceae bacterium]|nr:SDR family oxidoreductase [Crocinitomicaceae bacterium]